MVSCLCPFQDYRAPVSAVVELALDVRVLAVPSLEVAWALRHARPLAAPVSPASPRVPPEEHLDVQFAVAAVALAQAPALPVVRFVPCAHRVPGASVPSHALAHC